MERSVDYDQRLRQHSSGKDVLPQDFGSKPIQNLQMFSALKMAGVVLQLFWVFFFVVRFFGFFIYSEVGHTLGNQIRFVKE